MISSKQFPHVPVDQSSKEKFSFIKVFLCKAFYHNVMLFVFNQKQIHLAPLVRNVWNDSFKPLNCSKMIVRCLSPLQYERYPVTNPSNVKTGLLKEDVADIVMWYPQVGKQMTDKSIIFSSGRGSEFNQLITTDGTSHFTVLFWCQQSACTANVQEAVTSRHQQSRVWFNKVTSWEMGAVWCLSFPCLWTKTWDISALAAVILISVF